LEGGAHRQEPMEKLTAAFISKKMGREVSEVKLRDQDKMGGMSAEIGFIDVKMADDQQIAMVVKACAPGNDMKIAMGCAREALFYQKFSAQLVAAGVPTCYFGEGDMATGEMLMFMECIEDAVPAGVFFGAGNPNNWSVKDKLQAMCEGNPTAKEVTTDAFRLYAHLHCSFWQHGDLLDTAWLRACSWYRGEEEEKWRAAQNMAMTPWASFTKAREEGTSSPIQWDPHLVACLNASFAKVDWEAFQSELQTRPYTLCHGDCHPHNALWTRQRTKDASLRLIDFEQVGVGSPAQDLGQWMISHMQPDTRRDCEKELVAAYHADVVATLKELGKDSEFTFEMCWEEYVAGGAGRWVWFVPVLAQMCPAPMGQYFHDQLAAFLHTHVPDPSDSPMPRV